MTTLMSNRLETLPASAYEWKLRCQPCYAPDPGLWAAESLSQLPHARMDERRLANYKSLVL